MPLDRITTVLRDHVANLEEMGTAKGAEKIVTGVLPPSGGRGPRFHLQGEGEKEFLRMNSNSYLGLSLRPEIMKAEEEGTARYGAGPGAVRFISGTYDIHVELEQALATFHDREEAMIFSSAYATIMGTISPLITNETAIISDELNHNCIINAIRLSRPLEKVVYPHLDMGALEDSLIRFKGQAKRAVVITDGIFSMRGDHAPMDEIMALARKHDQDYPENVVVVMDDSHGVGAFGKTGRGTEEFTSSPPVDILVGTLGKAFGVNGGYVTSDTTLIRFLRESAPFYIYSNPITPGEAKAALASLHLLDSAEGRNLLVHLRAMTRRFEEGLGKLGMETIPGAHPVVPLMVRDTTRTRAMVKHLYANGILATGLAYPVVPKGDEEIRFQINADHTEADVDRVLEVLGNFQG
ncbi:MAG: aminotransferase class I/II-fold pyridoxal phosphate-dependent enzyme [Longimicrobiales bacterium]